MSDPKRYEAMGPEDWRWGRFIATPTGEFVYWEDHARLKAEVERLEPELEQRCRELNLSIAQQAIQLRQIGELKAEVERLTDENVTLRLERMQDETGKRITFADYARLKAEVERLTEKVRKIAEQVTKERKSAEEWHGRMTDDYNNPNGSAMGQDVVEASASLQAWEKAEELLKDFAAKEGKPSETKSPSFIEDLGNGVEKHDLLFRYPAKEGKSV